MDAQTEPQPFNPWWAVILVLLVFNILPIPFYLILESIGGDWLMQNPVEVESNHRHKDFQSSCRKKCSGFTENPNPP